MLKNLYNLEHMLASIALKDTLYNSLVVLYHKPPSTAERRAMIMRHIARISEDAKNLRKDCINAIFNNSPYGVKILDREGCATRILIKGTSEANINSYLFSRISDPKFTEQYVQLTAREALSNFGEVSGINREDRDNLRKRLEASAKEEMNSYRKPFGWTNQIGLGVVSKQWMWLFASKKLEKQSYFKDGVFSNNNTRIWNGVIFKESSQYSNHYAPKDWVMGTNYIVYPRSIAKSRNMEIMLPTPDSLTMYNAGKINDIDQLTFSHSCGYFDGSRFAIEERILVDPNDQVDTDRGRYNRLRCVYIPRHNIWRLANRVIIVVLNGQNELRDECVYVQGEYYHRTDEGITRCRSCGNHEHVDRMESISSDSDDVVCRSCVSNFADRLNRMCYSTDVLDHKGFGTTNTKINGKGVYVGLELEVYADFDSRRADKRDVILPINKFAMSKQNTYCVATQDGSLDGVNGIEYIFRPEGLNQQKHNVHEFVNGVGKHLLEDAGDGYGLHIHVSSHFLSELDKVRIDNFIATFEKYFRHIGARGQTEYQEAKRLDRNEHLRESHHNKYRMLNISKDQTIEFRFPKSLVNEVHVNMNLELALAVTMFCKYNLSNITLNTKKCSPLALRKFIQYVSVNKKQYPLLNAENNANIDLKNLAKYSKRWSQSVTVHHAEDETYALCA